MNGKVFILLLICRFASCYPQEVCTGLNRGNFERQPCERCYCDYARKTCYTPSCGKLECDEFYPEIGACCPMCRDGTPSPEECNDETNYFDWELEFCERCDCQSGERVCTSRAGPCPPTQCANPIPGRGSCCPVCPGETQPPLLEACDGYGEGDFWSGPKGCGMCTCKSGRKVCSKQTPDGAIPCAKAISVTGVSCPDGIHCDPDRCPEHYEFNSTKCECECKERDCLLPQDRWDPRCCECVCNLAYKCPGEYTLNPLTCSCEYCPPRYCGVGLYFKQEVCGCLECGTSISCEEGSVFTGDGYTCKCMTEQELWELRNKD